MQTTPRSGGKQQYSIFDEIRPDPISILKRTKAPEAEKSLNLPISPAFVNNFRIAKKPEVKPVLDFCKEKNIPFKSEESRFYKINRAKQQHRQFNKTIAYCFENYRPSEYETGYKMMTSDNPVAREDTGFVNETYCDTRPIYMPPLAQTIMNKITNRHKSHH